MWDDPATEPVGGGIFRIPLPLPGDGLRAVNVYAIDTGDGLVMIDAGWALAESEEQLVRSLAEVGFGLDDIRSFLVTHVHRDHYSQAVTVRAKFGSSINVGIGEAPSLIRTIEWQRSGEPPRNTSGLVRAGAANLIAEIDQNNTGRPAGEVEGWELPDSWLDDRAVVAAGSRSLQVIRTPGHTTGHVVFRDAAANLLFAGDHVLPHITPSIGFEPVRVRYPLRDYLDSLKLLLAMPDSRLLPAHGPIADSAHARIAELLDHHEQRLSESEAVVKAGASTAYEAASALTWTRRRRRFDEMDLFNRILATNETAAHLDVLVLQGRLVSHTEPDGTEFFRTP